MSYNISGTLITGGDTPEEPGNPRTFPQTYNALVESIQEALDEVDTTETGLQNQINTLQTELNQLRDDFEGFKITTESRLDALEAEE